MEPTRPAGIRDRLLSGPLPSLIVGLVLLTCGTAVAQSGSLPPPGAGTSAFAPFWQQGNKLIGTGGVGTPGHGHSVAVSADGNTALTGSYNDDTVSGGIGAAWVWTRSGGVWTQQGTKLVGTGATGAAWQGWSVALSADGNTALVGGYKDDGDKGAAWVWTRSNGIWTQEGNKLVGSGADNSSAGAAQGSSVALSGDGNTAIVGGRFDDSTGAAWVWTRSNGVWTQQGNKLVGTGSGSAPPVPLQGTAVALSYDGNTALVGGPADNPGGAVWVYTRSSGVWTQQGGKLHGSGGVGASFQGFSVALSADGNTALVGAISDNASTGAAWVWTRAGGVWTQEGSKLVGSGAVGPYAAGQGASVSLSADGNTAIVGGIGDNTYTGATWVWTRSGGVWTQQGNKLVGSGAVGTSFQGISVGLSGDGHTAIVGGSSDASNVGAAWVFTNTAIASTELVANGNFEGGLTNWQTFATPDISYINAAVSSGIMQFSRVPPPPATSNQATVFQETGVPLVAGAPLLAQFALGNTSSVRKYIKVLVIDGDFTDLAACTFWLPPNASQQAYQLKTHTTKPWSNAAIYFYAGTANAPGDTGSYLVDNVSLQYVPAQASSDHTDCVDPLAPTAPGGGAGPNLLTNGDFGTNALPPWTTFGTITAQDPAGVLQMIRPTGTPPAGVVKQQTSSTVIQTMTAGQILTASFQLGNSSAVRKRVTVIMHDNDFSDLVACVFWLAPGQALSNYSMVGWASKAWADATLSFYAASIGPDQWTLVDNVIFQRTPGAAIVGSTCLEPAGSGWVQAPLRMIVLGTSSAPSGATSRQQVVPASPSVSGTDWVTDGGFSRTSNGTAWEAIAAQTGVTTLRVADMVDLRDATRATLSTASWLTAVRSSAIIRLRAETASEWITLAEVLPSDTWQSIEVALTAFVGEQVEVELVFDGVAPLDVDVPDTWWVDALRMEIEH